MNETLHPGSDFEQLRWRSAEVAAQTAQFDRLSFEEILALAPAVLRSLISGARLQVTREHEQQADGPLSRGPVQLANGSSAFASCYVGPAEPVWFTAYGFSEADQLTLALFFDRLEQALQAAGYAEELNRQARRDWLTGLLWGDRLKDMLQQGLPDWTPMALFVIDPLLADQAEQSEEQQLRLRWFAHALRLSLGEEESAYRLERGVLAVLTPERELSRIDSTVRRLEPAVKLAYALSGEASGPALLELALSRLEGGRRDRLRATRTRRKAQRVGQYPLTIHCGAPTAAALLEQLTGAWRFTGPLSLVLDQPAGYALSLLPKVKRPVLVLTDGASHGYLHDLLELEPEGLVFGELDPAELRRHLEAMAGGERVYVGPLLERSPLFPRERQVWRLIAHGLDNEAIARRLGIGERTVANYFTGLKEKLHLPTRSAVALAYWGRLKSGLDLD